ncbi:MAG: hypoxanthine phosphoribosyltransferase [Chlamydiae bacterium]|nr:hypoxanthine phosphoribosyltransferase [Chlamydiota bacterium]
MKTCLLNFFIFMLFSCFAGEENLDLIISSEEIAAKIKTVGKQISSDYANKNLSLIVVMKGGICITADLMRAIEIPFKFEFLKASSYGNNGMSAGKLTINGIESLDIEGRDVLLVDDIFETGNTLQRIIKELSAKNPSSIKTLTLLVKEIPRKTSYLPDYILFHIPDLFVIGYGLDYKEFYRGLPAIYAFPENKAPF